MAETKIRVEINDFQNFFPFYIRMVSKKLRLNLLGVKKYKNYFLIDMDESNEKICNFIENLYNYGNFFNIQGVKFTYKPLAK